MKTPVAEWLHWPETTAIIKAFSGVPIRFVGGAVRDWLLDITVNDVDLATSLPPDKVTELLSTAGIKVVPTGIAHGTVTALVGARHFEITTLRRDVSTDGRRAVIAYTDDWREDASRRDFTMNALYCDTGGEITDYFGGVEDVRNGRVRFIGDPAQRINEDALRILRFFRFNAYYGKGEMEQSALASCSLLAAQLDNLSGERIQQEMFKLLVADNAADVIAIMQEYHILHHVILANVSADSLRQLPSVIRKAGIAPHAVLALALLLRRHKDVGKLAEDISMRWKLSKAHSWLLSELCASHFILGSNERELKKQIRALGKDQFTLQVITVMAEGADGLPALKLARHWHIPLFPLTGGDLIECGVSPGKQMGALLGRLEQYWEERDYMPDRNELIDIALGKKDW